MPFVILFFVFFSSLTFCFITFTSLLIEQQKQVSFNQMIMLCQSGNCIGPKGRQAERRASSGSAQTSYCAIVVRDCDVYRLKRRYYLTLATAHSSPPRRTALVARSSARAAACGTHSWTVRRVMLTSLRIATYYVPNSYLLIPIRYGLDFICLSIAIYSLL